MPDPAMRTPVRLLLILAGLLLPALAAACVKSLRWNEDPPYSMRLANSEIGGLQVELHRAVLQQMGCKAVLVEMPFARALTELQLGRLDLLPGTFDRPERREFAWFSQPVQRVRNLLYLRRADLQRSQGKDLATLVAEGWQLGVQVGVIYGPAYAKLLKDPAAQAKLQSVPRRSSLWLMLERGRVDAVPADELSAAYELGALGLKELIVASSLVLSTEGVGTAISKHSNDPAFVERFNAALQAMKADGRYAALLRRYGLSAEGAIP